MYQNDPNAFLSKAILGKLEYDQHAYKKTLNFYIKLYD